MSIDTDRSSCLAEAPPSTSVRRAVTGRTPAAHDSGLCLSEEEVLAFSEGSLMPAEIDSVNAHLDWCPACQELLNAAVHQWDHPPAHGAGERIWMATFGPGQVIAGRYRIERFLGRGGMGEVYSAFDNVLYERVAIKTLLSTTCDNPHAVRRLLAEARLARRITHPNVCRIHDVGVHEEHGRVDERLHFLTMELIDGKRLGQILRGGAMNIPAALSIARQILSGLEAAHHAGVLHRDLKSDNVMLAGQSVSARVAITDFGLSQSLRDEPRACSVGALSRVGSVPYMAPEQILGGELGPWTDLFGFGVVLFEMLCGRLPFSPDEASPRETGIRRRRQRAEAPSNLRAGVRPALDDFVLRCLKDNPEDRYAHATDALAALSQAIN
jgi:serine/threonine protein kinase